MVVNGEGLQRKKNYGIKKKHNNLLYSLNKEKKP